jgi:hypothetical protein
VSDFCRQHGFYAPCPSCSGEEVIEEIPIMDGDSGVQLGVFTFNQGIYEDAMALDAIALKERIVDEHFRGARPNPVARVESPPLRSSGMPPAQDHIPLPVNPGLYARVKTILHRHQ